MSDVFPQPRPLPRPLTSAAPNEQNEDHSIVAVEPPPDLHRILAAHQQAAQKLLLTPTQKLQGRARLADFLRRCERYNWLHFYTQARPYEGLGLRPEVRWDNDCSAYVGCGFDWIRLVLGIPIVDPLGYHFSGYGWTGSIFENNKQHRVPLDHVFMVGDLALYGSSFSATEHVVICRQKGDVNTSIWSSNGRPEAPEPVRLMYRGGQNLLGVFRPQSLL